MLSSQIRRLYYSNDAMWKEITSFPMLLSILTDLTRKLEQGFSFSNQIMDAPLDEKIQVCYMMIRKHTCVQNNGLLFAYKYQDWSPIVVIIDIFQQRCFQLNIRISSDWFLGTILEGQMCMDQAIYRPILWSLPNPITCGLPTVPPNSQLTIRQAEGKEEDEDDNSVKGDECGGDCERPAEPEEEELLEPQRKILKTELQHLQKTNIPDQRKRTNCCGFYVRDVKYLLGERVKGGSSAADYVLHHSKLNELLSPIHFVQDYMLCGIEIRNELDGVYAFQHQKDKVDKQLGLSKTIPFSYLHNKIVSHLKIIPGLCRKFDFSKTAHFQVSYYGSSKPGIYLLHALKGKKMVQYGIAYIPTLAIQQYVVHLLKTRGTSKPLVMKCVFAPGKKKWTPIKFILKRKDPDPIEKIYSPKIE